MNLKKLLLISCLLLLPYLLLDQIIIYTPNSNVTSSLFSMTLCSSSQNFTFSRDQKDFCGLILPLPSFVLKFRYASGLPIDMAVVDFAQIDALAIGDVLSVSSGGCTTF